MAEEADLSDQELEEQEEEQVTDLSSSDVCTKYRKAAEIANAALEAVAALCVADADVVELCAAGDAAITERCAGVYNKKVNGQAIDKGVGFPTCVSVNECVCHNSPLVGETPHQTLSDGDMVKIDLGCHIDGYIAVAAHTIIVGGAGASAEAPIEGRQADVIKAAYQAAEVAQKMIKAGNTNTQVTEAIARVAASYECEPMAGTLMHQMKRFVIDGNKCIILKEDAETKVDEITFETHEVYAVDVCMSTGEGKAREGEMRTSVLKRAVDKNYRLKMRNSRALLTEVNSRFPTLPFTLRAMEDERQAKMGVVECVKHDLLHPYPVLYEREGDFVAHFKFTVLVLSSGTAKITGLPVNLEGLVTDKTVDEETAAILATSSKKKRKKKKKSKNAAPAADAAEESK